MTEADLDRASKWSTKNTERKGTEIEDELEERVEVKRKEMDENKEMLKEMMEMIRDNKTLGVVEKEMAGKDKN